MDNMSYKTHYKKKNTYLKRYKKPCYMFKLEKKEYFDKLKDLLSNKSSNANFVLEDIQTNPQYSS